MNAKLVDKVCRVFFIFAFVLGAISVPGQSAKARELNPHLEVRVSQDQIQALDWPPGDIVTLTIDNPGTQQSPDYTTTRTVGPAPWNPNENAAVFDLNDIFHYQVGDLITVSDGSLTRIHTVVNVAVTHVDLIADTVSGIADPGAEVQVNIHSNGAPYRKVTADGNGQWVVNFAAPWNDQGTYDLTDFNGAAYRYDDDGDASLADFPRPDTRNPKIEANLDDSWIHASDWPSGALLTLTISGPDVNYLAQTTDERFYLPQTIKHQAGYIITVTDGVTTKTFALAPVQVTQVDVDADTVSGTATPLSHLEVHTDTGGTGGCCAQRLVTADALGNWVADFHDPLAPAPITSNYPTADLVPGSPGQAIEYDGASNYYDHSNQTWIDWNAPNPTIEANITGRWIVTREHVFPPMQPKWPLGSALTLTVDDPSNGADIDYTGMAIVDYSSNDQGRSIQTQVYFAWPDIGLGPGFIVTVTGNGTSKTLIIASLQANTVDVQADTVAGTASPGATIQVCAYIPNNCINRYVVVDGSGNWLANYHIPGTLPDEQETVDLMAGSNGDASEYDNDRDQTSIDWRVPNPRLAAILEENKIYGYEWPDGGPVTLTIDDPSTMQIPDFTETKTAIVTSEDINQAVVSFDPGSLTLRPGMSVTMTDGTTIKTHTLIRFGWSEIDFEGDIISGTAEPGMQIYIWAFDETGGVARGFVPEADGSWTSSFAVQGDEPYETTLDLHPGMGGGMTQIDHDGDQTQIDWSDISMALTHPQLTVLSPAKVWIGLKNSDDVGTKFDLLAEIYQNSTLIGSGRLDKVNGGSSGFNNAKLNTIPLTLFAPIDWLQGATLSLKLYVRNTCYGNTHNSGTARLWYNDASANSQFGATIDDASQSYFLGDGFTLSVTPGSGPRKTIDMAAGKPCSPFKLFGTWSIMP